MRRREFFCLLTLEISSTLLAAADDAIE